MIFSFLRNRRARKAIKREEDRRSLENALQEWRNLYNTPDPTWLDDLSMYNKSRLFPALLKLGGFTLEEIGSSQEEMDTWGTPRTEEGREAMAA